MEKIIARQMAGFTTRMFNIGKASLLIFAAMRPLVLPGCGGGNSKVGNSPAPPPVLQVVTFTLIPPRDPERYV